MRTPILTLILLFFSPFLFAQSGDKVDQIRKTVEQINKDTAYTIKTLDNEEWMGQMTDGGGQLTGYFKNGHLVKIIAWVGLSGCISVYEYYLQDTMLIFVYGQQKFFAYVDSTGTFDFDTQTLGMECRFYFDEDQLIKSKFTGQTRCSDEPSEEQAPYLLAENKRFLALLKN